MISENVTTESLMILPKYSSLSQTHALGFQIQSFLQIQFFIGFLHSHQHLSLFHS